MQLEKLVVHLRKMSDIQATHGNHSAADRLELEAQITEKKLEIRELQDRIAEIINEPAPN